MVEGYVGGQDFFSRSYDGTTEGRRKEESTLHWVSMKNTREYNSIEVFDYQAQKTLHVMLRNK